MKVSIIIPVYKVEKYLRQCIDSVLNQTYRDVEVILVDDGSPDLCPQICDEYASKDQRVIAIHQMNGGPSKAREAGILRASGDYLMMVDGDDWLDRETIEACIGEIRGQNLDCVIFSYVREYPGRSIASHILDQSASFRNLEVREKIYRRLFGLIGEELRHPERLESLGSCCMKLYRRDVALKGRFFSTEEVGSSEDTLFNLFALRDCVHIVYMDRTFYHYRKFGNSITSTYRSRLQEQWNRLFDIMEAQIEEQKLDNSFTEAMNARIGLSVFGIGMNEVCSSSQNRGQMKSIAKYLRSSRYHKAACVVPVKKMPFAWKTLILCARYRLSLLVWVELKLIRMLKRGH